VGSLISNTGDALVSCPSDYVLGVGNADFGSENDLLPVLGGIRYKQDEDFSGKGSTACGL